MTRSAWLLVLAICLTSSRAQADIETFAQQNGYLPGPITSTIHPGVLLWVETLGDDPGLIEILCTGMDAVGRVDLVQTQVDGAKYKAHIDDAPVGVLQGILQDINNDTPAALVKTLTLSISAVHARTLPDQVIASPLARASTRCLLALAERSHRPPGQRRGWPVMVTSELYGQVQCRATWSMPHALALPDFSKVLTMYTIGDWLPIHGGVVTHSAYLGAPQRLAWQHDQGSFGGELLAGGGVAVRKGSFRFGP